MVYTLLFFSLKCSLFHNSNLFPVLFTFYIQSVLKLKKNNSGAKRLNFPVPQSYIYKNTCIIVLDKALLNDKIDIQLLTNLSVIFVIVPLFPRVFGVLGGST